ncbi:metallophosphoesterase [Oribacterium sp. WCC10]|uniref:metallophosphoesterase n=1 Tax=Oribacterium sp. WCC10 TaxID=1855343 RepID=UPI0008F05CE9|nr:metallophosphoesterase [Oribacterium sp. WCC10]SFG19323.1 hypothetical protein SAMN05216356_10367 [Oribacterium sp. WCC10]
MFSIVINIIILVCLCGILLITISFLEINKLNVCRYEIRSNKLKSEHRFVYISDLHEKEFGEGNEELLKKIDELNPDFILIGGDLIVSHKVHKYRKKVSFDEVDTALQLLDKLRAKYTIYFSYGNHEKRLMEKAGLEDCTDVVKYDKNIQDIYIPAALKLKRALDNIVVLDDDVVSFEDFDITGVTLPMSYYRPLLFKERKELTEGDIRSHVGEMSQEKFHITMIHTPMYYKEVIGHGADLVLSGHYHGGTIRLPHFGALMTPQFQFLVKECAGEFRYGDGTLIVSRGLGTHSINIRINDLPEISFVTIKP